MKRLYSLLGLFLTTLMAQGQTVLLTENFDYTSGTTLQSNGWTAHSSGATNPIQVTDGGLSWTTTSYEGSGIGNAAAVNNNGSDENLPFSSYPNSGDIYVSFLMRVNNQVTSSNAGYFFHIGEYSNTASPVFTSISSAFRGRTFIAPGSTAAKFKLGLTFNSATVPSTAGVDLSNDLDTATTYLVVLKYSFVKGASNDSVSLFVFADGDNIDTEPTTPTIGPLAGTAGDLSFAQHVTLRQYNAGQNVTVDGILVKDGWNLTTRTTNTWNGSVWSSGTPPSGQNVVISANHSIASSFIGYNLTVDNGAVLSYGAAGSISIRGNIINNGVIDLGTSKILQVEGKYSGTGIIRSNGGQLIIGGAGEFGSINFDQTSDGTTNNFSFFELNRKSTGSAVLSNKVIVTGHLQLKAGELNTNGNLHLTSTSATATARVNFGTNDNIVGNVTVERFLPWASANNSGFRFVSHPLASNPVISTVTNLPTATNTLVGYNEGANAYEGISNRAGTWPQGIGYGVWTNAATTLSFTGALQLSDVSAVSMGNATQRWNFAGNPFASVLDWDAVTRTDMQNAVWVWVKDDVAVGGGAWASYIDGVAANGGSRYIAPMQGFMVRALASGTPSLAYPAAARVSNQTPSYQRTQSAGDIFRVKVSNANNSSLETVIRFHANATEDHDAAYDAEFVTDYFNGTPDLYTTDAQGVQYSINSLPALSTEAVMVPLQLETFGAGSFNFTFDASEMLTACRVQLEDRRFGTFTELANGQVVNITVGSNEAVDRFRLHFNSTGAATSVLDGQNDLIQMYSHEGALYIRGIEQAQSLRILDISGRTVFVQQQLSLDGNAIRPNLAKGTYVVQLVSAVGVKTVKVIF